MFRFTLSVTVMLLLSHAAPSLGESTFDNIPLSSINPGTTIDSKKAVSDGSQLVLLAKPRVAKGDVESASAKVRAYASMFNMVLIARTSRTQSGEFRLDDLSVGNCVRKKGGWIVVSSDSHKEHGVELDFFARQVLTRSESSLRQARVIAISDTYRIFDAEAIVRDGSEHHRMKIRHLVWVNKNSGKLATMQWSLRRTDDGELKMVEKIVHALPAKFMEDRVFSVKADEFTLGIPSEMALAIDKLPSGKEVPVTPELKKLASAADYSDESLAALVAEINRAIQQIRRNP
ncbi:hypothetical protein ACFL2H_03575 [Planctomycetota bacterium]